MNEKLVLIDGHSILNRAFYGIPDLTNAEGLHTNAIYGFLNILFKILEEEQGTYLVVAFDVKAPTFRHQMYKEYKGTRKPMPEELREQVPVMKDVLKAMGVAIVEKAGYEADDILGTIAKRSEKMGMEVSVVSGDRDLLQLASKHIKIRIPKTKKTGTEIEDYYEDDVLKTYQVTPLQFIDLKALMGDASDNIPGVKGIGAKTAEKIIVEYGSIEKAYENVAQIKPNKARENLETYYDMAQLSKVLATIEINCALDFDIADAKIENLYTEEAYEYFQRLEFKNFLKRFDCKGVTNESEKHFQKVCMLDEVEMIFTKAGKEKVVAFQFIISKEVLGAVLCFGEESCYYISIEGFVTKGYVADKIKELSKTVEILATLDLKKQLPHITFDNKACLLDVELAAYLLNPLKDNYLCEDIAKDYLGILLPGKAELFGKDSLAVAYETKPTEFLKYVCNEGYVSYRAASILKEKLEETAMYSLFETIEMPLLFALHDMESVGILVEAEALKTYGDALAVRIATLEKEIYEQAGETFNINSPKQLGVILFEKLEMPNGKKTKTGYSTAADVLEKLAVEYPIVSTILEYRQLTKLKSTYADGLANYIEEDGRIHSTFNQMITATGRISSTEPNLQNIPIRMELGRLIRKVFIPKEGYVFLDADYSQIELRLLAHMSEDEMLIEAYQEAQDIHRMTASQVFHIPFEEVSELQRRNAKAVNFGIVYGISAHGLSEDLNISRKEAGEYIERYFDTYPKIKTFLDGLVEEGKEKGYVTTLFGRRRPIPELKSSNFMQRSFGERIAMNSPIQGTAADIIKIAMIRVQERLKAQNLKSQLVLQVHDELLIETHIDEIDVVGCILKEEMQQAASLKVSLEIDAHQGNNWYEAK